MKKLFALFILLACMACVFADDSLAAYLEQIGAYKQLSDRRGSLDGGTYVTFGAFPQTIKANDVKITDTVELLNGTSVYKGSDGAWYVKVFANPYSDYKFSNGSSVSKGTMYYFKIEPIKWRVLTDNYNGKKLLLAESILTASMYHASSNNYKNSAIRAYLNDDFLNTAFTKSQQAKIAVTNVDNSADSTTDAGNNLDKATKYYCENTNDKIFLLSEREATTKSYGFTKYNEYGQGNSRIRVTTDYAKANYAWQGSTAGYGGWWWLRSPHASNSPYVCYVNGNGDANDYCGVFNPYGGVVPALTVTQ